jgi:hypothetical protein
VKKGRAKQADADAVLARITPTPDYEQLKGVDLIIEAVFEDRKVKAEATAKAAGRGRRQGGVRSNTVDAADHLARRRVEGPEELRRRALLLAGGEDDAGRDHHGREDRGSGARGRRSTMCGRSARRRSW